MKPGLQARLAKLERFAVRKSSCPSGRCPRPDDGPNVRKLIMLRVAIEAIPHVNGLDDAFDILKNTDQMVLLAEAARAWVESAIMAYRHASESDPGTVKLRTDDEIAGEILGELEERHAKSSHKSERTGEKGD